MRAGLDYLFGTLCIVIVVLKNYDRLLKFLRSCTRQFIAHVCECPHLVAIDVQGVFSWSETDAIIISHGLCQSTRYHGYRKSDGPLRAEQRRIVAPQSDGVGSLLTDLH